MPEELTLGELGRTVQGLRGDLQALGAGINARLDRVVTTDLYTLQNQHVEQRLAEQDREMQKERDEREALEKEFSAYRQAESERRERERQARLYQGIIPVLACLLTAVIAIWAVVK